MLFASLSLPSPCHVLCASYNLPADFFVFYNYWSLLLPFYSLLFMYIEHVHWLGSCVHFSWGRTSVISKLILIREYIRSNRIKWVPYQKVICKVFMSSSYRSVFSKLEYGIDCDIDLWHHYPDYTLWHWFIKLFMHDGSVCGWYAVLSRKIWLAAVFSLV